jgi:hypothetical protein
MKNITNTIRLWRKIAILLAVAGLTFAACEDPFGNEDTLPLLTGTVRIIGTAQVGELLLVEYNLTNGSGMHSHQWKRDGEIIGSDFSYRVQSVDVGYTITVTVTCSGNTGSKTSDPTAVVIVADPINQDPVATDFDPDNLTQTVGQVTPVTITPKEGKSGGKITVYYDGSETLPSAIGEYTVTFDVAAATGWNAASGLKGGTLTINAENQNPVADDFDIENLTQTEGRVTSVTITPKPGKSGGGITVYYDGSTMRPSAAGTYAITFDVEAATGWNAASGLDGGILTVNARVNAQIPVIVGQPVGATVVVGDSYTLSVEANADDGGTLSYRWFTNTSASNSGGTVISGAEGSTFNPPTGTEETRYYFVYVTNTIPYNGDGGIKIANVMSNVVEIRVTFPGGIVIDFDMDEWELIAKQTVQANSNDNKVFTVTGTYATYQWYLDGTPVGTSSSYIFNKPVGVYELLVVVKNNAGESRSGRYWITVNPSLTENVWANGDITGADGEDWYLLSVSSGTRYYIWWNDSKQGNNTKNGDIAVSARYVGSSSWIFGGTDTTVDSGWTTAQSFTSNQDGMVYIRVIPYTDTDGIGNYGIAYSTSNTRPAIYTVTFNANGGSGTPPAAQMTNPGYSIILPDGSGLSRSGYTFGGWFISYGGTETNYNVGASYTPSGNVTLSARWYTNYTVTFDRNGGTGTTPASMTGSYVSPVTLPDGTGFYRSGYTFGGWNTAANGTGTYYDAGSAYAPVYRGVILYAKWNIITTPLTANIWANGSIASTTREVGYSFFVISGQRYYVWWNDRYQGNSTKTLDVHVSAQYSNGTSIFSSVDSAYNTAQSFTANQTGIIDLIVRPSNTGNTGTYGIVYSTSSTRPVQ